MNNKKQITRLLIKERNYRQFLGELIKITVKFLIRNNFSLPLQPPNRSSFSEFGSYGCDRDVNTKM